MKFNREKTNHFEIGSFNKSNSKNININFTLVELLIIIAIIAILAAILLPALKVAREKAKGVECLGRLRHGMLAMNMYEMDYQGFLHTYFYDGKNEYSWARKMMELKYLTDKNVKNAMCPSFKPITTVNQSYCYGALNDISIDEGVHIQTSGTPRWTYIRTAPIKSPSDFFILGDTIIKKNEGNWFQGMTLHVKSTNWRNFMHSRHNQHVNLAFVDGHVNAHDHNTIISKIKKMHKDGLGTGNMPDYLLIANQNLTRSQYKIKY